jgi:hypothetical protein
VGNGFTYTPTIRKDRVYKEGMPRFKHKIVVEQKFYSAAHVILQPPEVRRLMNYLDLVEDQDSDFPLKVLTDHLKSWSRKNCKGRLVFGSFGTRWAIKLSIDFEHKSDLIMFKLVWGNL